MTLIGITCDRDTFTDSRGAPAPRFFCPESYVRAVAGAGADPLLLPSPLPERAADLLGRLDGIVVAGGDFDIPPSYFGEAPHPKLGRLQPERTASEAALLLTALARDIPLLAVCGGMQLLNVVQGGTLYQDLGSRPGTGAHEQPGDKRHPSHLVKVAPGSLLAKWCGGLELQVNSTHHQVIARVGSGLLVSGQAPDGVVEAIELSAARFAVGVQWHPEALASAEQLGLYRGLVAAARSATG